MNKLQIRLFTTAFFLVSICSVSAVDITVVNNDAFAFKIEHREHKHGSWSKWHSNGDISQNNDKVFSLHDSDHHEYRAYSETRRCVLSEYKGDSFKSKKKWTVGMSGGSLE